MPVLLLLAWELAVQAGRLDGRFFSAPSLILATGWTLLASGELLQHIAITLQRVLIGFAAGALPGLLAGLAMGLNPTVRRLIWPLASAWYPIPKIAILPLVIILFGIGETAKVMIVALSVFFLILLNTMTGVMQIDEGYRDVARQLKASRWQFLVSIAIPGSLPMVFAGLKLAMGFALLVIVGTELLIANAGLGYVIWHNYQTFRIDRMFVGLLATGLIGWLLTVILDHWERRAIPWDRSQDARR